MFFAIVWRRGELLYVRGFVFKQCFSHQEPFSAYLALEHSLFGDSAGFRGNLIVMDRDNLGRAVDGDRGVFNWDRLLGACFT